MKAFLCFTMAGLPVTMAMSLRDAIELRDSIESEEMKFNGQPVRDLFVVRNGV